MEYAGLLQAGSPQARLVQAVSPRDASESESGADVDIVWRAVQQGLQITPAYLRCLSKSTPAPTVSSLLRVAVVNDRGAWVTVLLERCGADADGQHDARVGYKLRRWMHTADVSLLTFAAQHGSVHAATALLHAKARVNFWRDRRRSPVFVAARRGQAPLVALLLAAKADIQFTGNAGRTPLFVAASRGHVSVVQLLLEANADVNFTEAVNPNPPGDVGMTPWHTNDMSALSEAIRKSHASIVTMLLEAKANVELADSDGDTPIFWAAASDNDPVRAVSVLLEANACVNCTNTDGDTPLSEALAHLPTLKCGEARRVSAAVIELLLAAKAHVDSVNRRGQTPLSEALAHFPTFKREAARRAGAAVIELLLAAKASADAGTRRAAYRVSAAYRASAEHRASAAAVGQRL